MFLKDNFIKSDISANCHCVYCGRLIEESQDSTDVCADCQHKL